MSAREEQRLPACLGGALERLEQDRALSFTSEFERHINRGNLARQRLRSPGTNKKLTISNPPD